MFGLVFGWGAMVGNDEPLATTALKSELTYSRQLGEGAPGVVAWTGGNPVGTNELKLWLGVSETGSWTSDAHQPVPTAAISNPAAVPASVRETVNGMTCPSTKFWVADWFMASVK